MSKQITPFYTLEFYIRHYISANRVWIKEEFAEKIKEWRLYYQKCLDQYKSVKTEGLSCHSKDKIASRILECEEKIELINNNISNE